MGTTEDLSRTCAKCFGPIAGGRAMKAKDKLYHADTCFVCSTCSLDLCNSAVYAKDECLFCESHYKEKFLSRCHACQEYITESCVKAMGASWHSHHFNCAVCQLNLATAASGFHEHLGQPHCENCYMDRALPKCRGCKKPITDKALKAMDAQWHVSCFVCKECQTTFEGHKSFYTIDDMPVCGPCAGIGQ